MLAPLHGHPHCGLAMRAELTGQGRPPQPAAVQLRPDALTVTAQQQPPSGDRERSLSPTSSGRRGTRSGVTRRGPHKRAAQRWPSALRTVPPRRARSAPRPPPRTWGDRRRPAALRTSRHSAWRHYAPTALRKAPHLPPAPPRPPRGNHVRPARRGRSHSAHARVAPRGFSLRGERASRSQWRLSGQGRGRRRRPCEAGGAAQRPRGDAAPRQVSSVWRGWPLGGGCGGAKRGRCRRSTHARDASRGAGRCGAAGGGGTRAGAAVVVLTSERSLSAALHWGVPPVLRATVGPHRLYSPGIGPCGNG